MPPRKFLWLLTALFVILATFHYLWLYKYMPSIAWRASQPESSFFTHSLYDASPLALNDSGQLPQETFNFTRDKPAWLTPKSPTSTEPPLTIRMAIISQPSEFERRKAFREYILKDLPKHEVLVDYRFMVGYAGNNAMPDLDRMVLEEQLIHRDIHIVDLQDNHARLGQKRWQMLKWAAEAHSSTYDYYLSVDTDAFIRLAGLARRLPFLHPELDSPRTQFILWGNLGSHKIHFIPNPYDNETSYETEDVVSEYEEWYRYPYGFGYLMSSALVTKLSDPQIVLPHHVHYPSDDVIIGVWIADWAPETVTVHDREGFHDALGHNWDISATSVVDWDTVCTHHVSVAEMKGMRSMKEFEGEWE